MRTTLMAIATILLGLSGTAAAHSPLAKTSPADGATLTAAPAEISFTFKRNLRMTKVTATPAQGDPLTLDLAGQTKFSKDHAVPFSASSAGAYTIEWRGLGDDGHAQKGTFSFTVSE